MVDTTLEQPPAQAEPFDVIPPLRPTEVKVPHVVGDS